ncbi:rhomboid family intramembrane serine protease GlpG [Paraglaciecola sp. 2405UD69-4]|uniref:rhomboid family intramembrane serine protease GlpG n=1 Tax=Paraglaciecola sp. 2405UD69-4 TaxID=3391836 RepID=UPI0039C9B44B
MNTHTKLVAFSKEQPARLLSLYLNAQGIQVEYSKLESDYAHGVMLFDSADLEKAKAIAEEFVLDPNNAKYQSAAWDSGESVQLASDSSFAVDNFLLALIRTPFTAGILVTCIVIYCLAMIGINGPYSWLQIEPLADLAKNWQWWRLLGPALIHFSAMHIAFNLLWWWMLGKQLEHTFGTSCLVLLFGFSALISNVAQLLITGPSFGGLSGVVYALVGCVWWLGWLKPSWGISLPKPMVGFLLVWLLVGYLDVLPVNMANTAHTAGLICGCVFAWLLVSRANNSISR